MFSLLGEAAVHSVVVAIAIGAVDFPPGCPRRRWHRLRQERQLLWLPALPLCSAAQDGALGMPHTGSPPVARRAPEGKARCQVQLFLLAACSAGKAGGTNSGQLLACGAGGWQLLECAVDGFLQTFSLTLGHVASNIDVGGMLRAHKLQVHVSSPCQQDVLVEWDHTLLPSSALCHIEVTPPHITSAVVFPWLQQSGLIAEGPGVLKAALGPTMLSTCAGVGVLLNLHGAPTCQLERQQ